MRILGIDPGLARTGWGLLEISESRIVQAFFGCIETSLKASLAERLHLIYRNLGALIQTHRPEALALETLYFAKHAKTLAMVGHARGICLLCAAETQVPIYEYTPKQIKLALTGYGGAEKNQMQLMIQRRLGLVRVPQPDDAADALAAALCHSQAFPLMKRLLHLETARLKDQKLAAL